jgi:hypothetical protein
MSSECNERTVPDGASVLSCMRRECDERLFMHEGRL